jgi:hypothetical protein
MTALLAAYSFLRSFDLPGAYVAALTVSESAVLLFAVVNIGRRGAC